LRPGRNLQDVHHVSGARVRQTDLARLVGLAGLEDDQVHQQYIEHPLTSSTRSDVPAVATGSPSLLEQCTKPFLFLSLTGAMWSATWGLSFGLPILRTVVPAAFAVAWAAGRFKPVLVRQLLLGTYYLIPATLIILAGAVP